MLLAVLLAAGCRGGTKVGETIIGDLGGNDNDSQMEFWHTLAQRPIASNDEAFHAVLLFLDAKDPANHYNGRVVVLKARGMLPASFNRPANEAVSRGTMAVVMVKYLQVKGGVMLRALGASERYAVREMQFVGMYPPSSPNQMFSGSEVVAVIGRAEDYLRAHPRDEAGDHPAEDEALDGEAPDMADDAAGEQGAMEEPEIQAVPDAEAGAAPPPPADSGEVVPVDKTPAPGDSGDPGAIETP